VILPSPSAFLPPLHATFGLGTRFLFSFNKNLIPVSRASWSPDVRPCLTADGSFSPLRDLTARRPRLFLHFPDRIRQYSRLLVRHVSLSFSRFFSSSAQWLRLPYPPAFVVDRAGVFYGRMESFFISTSLCTLLPFFFVLLVLVAFFSFLLQSGDRRLSSFFV